MFVIWSNVTSQYVIYLFELVCGVCPLVGHVTCDRYTVYTNMLSCSICALICVFQLADVPLCLCKQDFDPLIVSGYVCPFIIKPPDQKWKNQGNGLEAGLLLVISLTLVNKMMCGNSMQWYIIIAYSGLVSLFLGLPAFSFCSRDWKTSQIKGLYCFLYFIASYK
jgi:hypothetical protein